MDGIRLDAADVLDFDFMKALRRVANEVKPEFWLMGEVIHGDYSRWVNDGTLHSVTNYQLHKALYSGHNDHNYFEIAHTVKHLSDMGTLKLYNFTDNHDVERIYTKLNNKKHFAPVHILEYTLQGVPSVYYGSEFGIEGKKERWSDDSLRPELHYEDYKEAVKNNPCTALIARLGKVRQEVKALSYGDYRELMLTNRQYAFSRSYEGVTVVVTVNNDDSDFVMTVPAGDVVEYIGALSGEKVPVVNGNIAVNVKANSGEIWVPYVKAMVALDNPETKINVTDVNPTSMEFATDDKFEEENVAKENVVVSEELSGEEDAKNIVSEAEAIPAEVSAAEQEDVVSKAENVGTEAVENEILEKVKAAREQSFEEGRIAGLQEAILALMERNGNVTDQMRNDVYNQTHIPSLITWVKSFR